MGVHSNGGNEPDDDKDSDEAPETPLDEPSPPRVQDPPPQPGPKGPYVVRTQGLQPYGGVSR